MAPVKKNELDRAKAQLKGSLMLGLESIPNRMIRLGSSELYFGELASLDAIITLIDKVTVDAVKELAEELLQESRFLSIIFRPNGN